MSRFDEIRAAKPDTGFGVYALSPPGGNLTLEIYPPDGQIYAFVGATLEDVLLAAFPPDTPVEPKQPPTPSIFD